MQHEHRQDDTCLALAHVELGNGAGRVNAVLGHTVLHASNLQLLLDLKDKPLRVLRDTPFAPDLSELALELLNAKSRFEYRWWGNDLYWYSFGGIVLPLS
jgi:hypothetical protein